MLTFSVNRMQTTRLPENIIILRRRDDNSNTSLRLKKEKSSTKVARSPRVNWFLRHSDRNTLLALM